jgi:hypothetical protein
VRRRPRRGDRAQPASPGGADDIPGPHRADAIGLKGGAVDLERPSWIIPWELNLFQWPGPDVGRAPHPFGAWWRMGALTPALRRKLRDAVEAALAARRATLIRRTE